jgi:preprotein translocase SecE subunit
LAKTRAQRKAERRKREAQQARQAQSKRREDAQAQQRTQVPESADVAEAELAEQGADLEALREGASGDGARAPEAPAPLRADVGVPEEAEVPVAEAPEAPITEAPVKESRRERRRREREEARAKEERRKARERRPAEVAERQRGPVTGFIASCWAELKKVQWPDRETLIQASAVTILFVAVMAAYLGALDAVFNELVQLII